MSDFENRKPLKYTIKTDIQSSNRDNPNDDVVIIVRVISPDNSAIRFDLDCNGDGEYEYISSDKDQKCIYQRNSGNHQIWVRGEIPEMLLCARTCQEDDNNLCTFPKTDDDDSQFAVVSVDEWGDIEWKSMAWFAGFCQNLTAVPTQTPNLKQVTDLSHFFYQATKFDQPIDNWDVSSVTDMSGMFAEASSFNQSLDHWNVSKVTHMKNMFLHATSFNQPLDNWDVSNVTDMSGMFYYAVDFNQPIEKWNVSNVTDMSGMFADAHTFNQPIENWDVSNVKNMSEMFYDAFVFNQPLEKWNVSSVEDMSGMFAIDDMCLQSDPDSDEENTGSCTAFNQPLNYWNVSKVKNMSGMFLFSQSFNQPLEKWDVSSVTDMSEMFSYTAVFDQSLDKWNVSNVQKMREMFSEARAFNHYPKSWIVPKDDVESMFVGTKVEKKAKKSPLKTR